MVIVAIDVGTVRVGCAWSDSSVQLPFPVAVWERAQGRAEQALLEELKVRNAELLVVGLPLDANGNQTAICQSILAFVRRLSKRCSIRVVYVDEAFSSDDALSRLQSVGAEPRELDAYAACLILERYFAVGSCGEP
jgi:putative Holliday junction resolvase